MFYVEDERAGPMEHAYRAATAEDITDETVTRAIAVVEEMVTLAQIEGGRPAEDRYLMRCTGCCNCWPSNYNDPLCDGEGHPLAHADQGERRA